MPVPATALSPHSTDAPVNGPRARTTLVPVLDLARLCAAMMVVLYHYVALFRVGLPDGTSRPFLPLLPVAQFGYLGVQLFFMVSGFVIFRSAAAQTPARFLRARVRRLYPAFLVCCSLTWLAMTVSHTHYVSPLQFVYGLTMFNGVIDSLRGVLPTLVDGAYWTLAIEWKFYAIVLLFMLGRKAVPVEAFLWGWLAVACVYTVTSATQLDRWLIASWAPYFVAGAAAQFAQRDGWRASLAAMTLVALGLCIVQAHLQFNDLRNAFVLPGSAFECDLIIGAMFVFFVTVVARRTPLWSSASRSWPMLGGISYPLYLLHAGLGAVAFTLWCRPWNYWTFLLTLVPSMLLLAWAVHRYVEVALWGWLARRAMKARRAAADAA